MSEEEFLEGYDPAAYPRVAVTVDLVLMTVLGGAPAVLLVRRGEHPFKGCWALPGGFVGAEEGLEEAARRLLAAKAQVGGAWLEQLYTFGDVGRDPRMRVVTVAWFALLPPERLVPGSGAGSETLLASLGHGEGGAIRASAPDGQPLSLAFDHSRIVALALERLRGKLDYAPLAFSLLPELFTLRRLQHVHEAILGRPLNKPAFRRRMLDRGWLQPTGERESGASYRPAELFRFAERATPSRIED